MNRFLFRFGYCTPAQLEANKSQGWDDEESGALFIEAEDAKEALQWGCEIAELFVKQLFEREGNTPAPGWKESKFAFWIDDNPAGSFSSEELKKMRCIKNKERPPSDEILSLNG